MSTVLVTGASGFIGRPTVSRLSSAGHQVHAVARQRPAGADNRVRWHEVDLHDHDRVRDLVTAVAPERALHLAWDVSPGFASSPENVPWAASSLLLLRALGDVGCQRFVTAGTCFEYDWSEGVCHEADTPTRPSTLYGTAKLAVGSTAIAAAEQLGMEVAIGRVFFLFGPGEPPGKLVAHVVRSLLRGERAACTTGAQSRDYLYVDDVAAGLAALVDSEVTGAVNIGRGQGTRVADLVTRIGEAIGRPELVGLGDRVTPAGEPPAIVADTTRLRTEVGAPPPLPLEEAIGRTVAWWRDQSTPAAD